MPSKTLCSKSVNGTLLRKNLSRFWPLWGLATFVGTMLPLALLTRLMQQDTPITPADAGQGLYMVLTYAVPILSLCYAILCATAVWSYLYQPRSVGLMHTLPIRREGLFLTNFLSGMLMMLIPYAVTGTLSVLVMAAFGGFNATAIANTVLGVLGLSFFYFASATCVAFITGNTVALPLLYFLFHFLAVLSDWLLTSLADGFIFGVDTSYLGVAEWLSPTVYLLQRFTYNGNYTEVQMPGEHYTTHVLESISLENFWLVGAYALVGAALTALALVLYRRRGSEQAGDVVAMGWMRPLFRYGMAALAALLGGRALYYLFWYSYQSTDSYDVIPMAVCMTLAGVIGFYGASMLLAKSLRVFRGSVLRLAVVAVAALAVCLAMHFDVAGVATRVPESGQIDYLTFRAAGNTYTFEPGRDDALLEQARAVHSAIVADRDYIQDPSLRRQTQSSEETLGETYASVYFSYVLTSGARMERNYSIPLTAERMEQAGTYDQLLGDWVNSTAMRLKRIHADDDRYTLTSAWGYNDYLEDGGTDFNSREAAALYEAVQQDAREGSWGEYRWFTGDQYHRRDVVVEFHFRVSNELKEAEEAYYLRDDFISIYVRSGMTHTVARLVELGLLDAETVERMALEEQEETPSDETWYYDTGPGAQTVEIL